MSSVWKKIGDIAEVKGGKRLPKGHDLTDEVTEHPYLRIVDFDENGLDPSNVRYLHADTYERISRYTISSNDIYIISQAPSEEWVSSQNNLMGLI